MFTLISNLAASTHRRRQSSSHTNECWPLDGVSISGSPFQLPYPWHATHPEIQLSRYSAIQPPYHFPFPLCRAALVLRTCLCRFMAAFCCLMIPQGTICTLWLFTGRRRQQQTIQIPSKPTIWHPNSNSNPVDQGTHDDLRWRLVNVGCRILDTAILGTGGYWWGTAGQRCRCLGS